MAMPDRGKPSVPGQGGAKKTAPRAPLKGGNSTGNPTPSIQKTKPTKSPGSGVGGSAKTANKISRP